MAKAKLLVNMIFGGVFHRFDTILDREKIPPNLRKAKFISDNLVPEVLPEPEEIETDEIFFEGEEEEPPQPPPVRFKRKVR